MVTLCRALCLEQLTTSGSFQSPGEDKEAAAVLVNTKVLICKEGQETEQGRAGGKYTSP